MPLSAAKPLLEIEIKAAFKNVMKEGAKDGADPDKIIADLAGALTSAIDMYVNSAQVVTTVTTAVVGTAAPVPPAGAAGVVGAGSGAGNGNLL